MSETASYEVEFVRRPEGRLRRFLVYVWAAVAVPYLAWRFSVVDWGVWYAGPMYAAELFGSVTMLAFLWVTREIHVPLHRPAALDRTVDVLIPTYNEPFAVLKPTIVGALAMRGVNNVFVLDDANRSEVKAMARKLGARYYATSGNKDAKAGNVNNGLRYTRAQFVVTLDADHVPLPNLIERMLGYFDDPGVGFVQAPQTYYNEDSFVFHRQRRRGRLWSEQAMFYEVIQPAKNRHNAAYFVGTTAVFRRAALDSIGGFACGTITEDIHTAVRIHARGWKSVFVPEPLAYGLEAASLKEFHRQRQRWAAGNLMLLLRSPDSPLRIRGLTFAQRLHYTTAIIGHVGGVFRLFYLLLAIACVLSLEAPVTFGAEGTAIALSFLGLTVGTMAIAARGTYSPLRNELLGLCSMLAQVSALASVVSGRKRFWVSRKRLVRRERTSLKRIIAVVGAANALCMARAADLLLGVASAPLDQHRGLLAAMVIVCGANAALLFGVLVFLSRYEQHAPNTREAKPSARRTYERVTTRARETPPAAGSLSPA